MNNNLILNPNIEGRENCLKLNEICDYKAPRIPILPEVVNNDFVRNELGSISHLPVGVEKETLDIAKINLADEFMYNITGEDITAEPQFIKGIINNILETKNTECIVFDTNSVFSDIKGDRITYSTGNCDEAVAKLNEAYSANDPEKTTICFIANINNFLGKIGATEKTKFTTLINDSNCINFKILH